MILYKQHWQMEKKLIIPLSEKFVYTFVIFNLRVSLGS